jgi:long-chain fatty acid transport protein
MTIRFGATAACAFGLLFARDALAAGIALDIQSARGTGMAGAVTAMIDDSSAIFYNPAGIAQGRILDAQVGDSLIIPSVQYTSPQGASTRTQFNVSPPLQAYESGGLTDNLSIGVGVFTPFGLTVPWPPDWAGKSIVTKSTLATYDFNPTVAYRVGPLRLGVGMQLERATVDLQRKIETGSAEVSTELGAAAWGAGYNAGAQLEAIERYLSLGVHYRSAVKINFTGAVHFDNVPLPFRGLLYDQLATTTLTLPDILQMGIASRPIPNLVLDADLVWNGWSKFRSIDVRFPRDASGQLGHPEPKSWNDTLNVHVGGEWSVDESWRVRAGVLYDPSPSPSVTLGPDVPDANRINLAVGAGYRHASGFGVDLGYQFIFLLDKTSTGVLAGTYGGNVNVVGISVSYRTPRSR